jgi:hypothetical protein
MSLSAVGATIAIIGVSAPSAAAKGVELTIRVHGPEGHASKPFRIAWRTYCRRAISSGPEGFGGSVTRNCPDPLKFDFLLLSADGDPFDTRWFSGSVDNPIIGQPGIALDGEAQTFFSKKDGYHPGQARDASTHAYGWTLKFRARREGDSPRFKRFDLWIWITGP